MTKPKLFIGSSAENKHLAEAVQASLSRDFSAFIWTQGVFEPSQYPLESLNDALSIADFAILVCAPDDLTLMRGEHKATVRDNVIFELGLFMGRLGRERTFLISPRGVNLHLPTDLNGLYPENYDPEDLQNAEAALGAACTKLKKAMLRQGRFPRREEEETANVAVSAEAPVAEAGSAYDTPTDEWTIDTYEIALLIAAGENDASKFDRLDEAFAKSSFAADRETLAVWQATREIRKISIGRRVDLTLIRRHAESFPDNLSLARRLADALSYYGEEEAAASLYLDVAERAGSVGMAVGPAGEALAHTGSKDRAAIARRLEATLRLKPVSSVDDQTERYRGLEQIAKALGLTRLSLSLSEARLSLTPDSNWSRYTLAGRYSSDGQNELAMLHYERLAPDERDSGGWNNLGVSYARLNMSGKATTAYQEASRLGASISEGNLAHKLISAGFLVEAKAKVDAALLDEDRDSSLLGVLAAVQAAEEAENETYRAALETAKLFRAAHIAIGTAALSASRPPLSGQWRTERCVVQLVELEDGTVHGEGMIIAQAAEGAFGLFGTSQPRTRTTPVKIILTRIGNALEGTFEEQRTQGLLGLLGSFSSEAKLLLRVTEDGQFIHGIETSYQTKLIQWTREQGNLIEHDAGA